MSGFAILIFIVVIALIIFGGIHSHRLQEERRQALTTLAAKYGWHFDPTKDYDHDDSFQQFAIFSTGDSRYAYNRVFGALTIGDTAWPIQLGDYHYEQTSGTGKDRSTTTYRFSYLLLTLPYRAIPDLTIREEGLFDKLASFVGFDDIDFESAEFSKRFYVKAPDKRFAYDVVHPRMMQFLLDAHPPAIDIQSGVCCLTKQRRIFTPQEFETLLAWSAEFFALWPTHLTSELQR